MIVCLPSIDYCHKGLSTAPLLGSTFSLRCCDQHSTSGTRACNIWQGVMGECVALCLRSLLTTNDVTEVACYKICQWYRFVGGCVVQINNCSKDNIHWFSQEVSCLNSSGSRHI